MQVNLITVEVTRDAMTKIVSDIPAHEVEVQQLIFGRDNVNVINDAAGVAELDENEEPDRIVRKYGDTAVIDTFGPNFHNKVIAACKANTAEGEDKPKRGRPAKVEE